MIRLYEYNLHFKETLETASGVYSYRKGIIIRYTDSGCDIVSEIAPLPPFTTDSLTEVIKKLRSSKSDIDVFLKNSFDLDELNRFINMLSDMPSVRYGLSWLGATVFDSRNDSSGHFTLKAKPNKTVLINDLIGSTRKDLLKERMLNSIKFGFRTIKIKCMNPDPDTADIIRTIAADHPGIKIRLDANLSWHPGSADPFNKYFHDLPIEYIEEPFLTEMSNRIYRFKAPIAKDESIKDLHSLSKLLQDDDNLYIVIKPMNFGTLFDLAETILNSRSMNRKIVISNLLESAVGRFFNLGFASCFGDPELAHGLNTGKYFESDLLKYLSPDHGVFHTDRRLFQSIQFNQLNSDLLKEIDNSDAE